MLAADVGQVVRSAARWLPGLYLLAYLVFSGPLLFRLWRAGQHPTPDHWHQHVILDELGYADHHNPASGEAPPAQGETANEPAVGALSSFVPLIVAGPMAASFAPETLHVLVAVPPPPLGLTRSARPLPLDSILPGGVQTAPPTKPPSLLG